MFSKRLQFFMDKYNYNQAKLAELLGVSPPAINKMLKDGSTPGIENLKKLRKIFNTTIDFLLGVDLEDALEMLNTSNNEVSIVLTNLRIGKKLTQKEFAKFNDITLQEVIDIENGISPSIDTLQKICYYSNISLYEIIGKQQLHVAEDIEYQNIVKFAIDMENKDYIKIAMQIKESGLSPEEIVIARKL